MKKIDISKVLQILTMSLIFVAPLAASADSLLAPGSCMPGQRCDTTSITGLIKLVINWLLSLAGLIAVLFLIVGGFWYITSAGNEEQAEKGKATVVNAIIGIVIIVLSWVIVNVVSNLVSSNSASNI